MASATVTSKGQITIPLPVRERLGLRAGDQLDFAIGPEGVVTLQPKKIPFEQLLGVFRNPRRRPVTVREMDRGIEKAVRERWARKNRRRRK